ncbi:MAG: AtpZ/AtpI family protein [Patescibacteria group bacterium]
MKEQAWWLPAILMFSRLSAWVIGPVIIGLFVGKWLDNKYQSKPWLFLLSIGIAFIISMFGLIKSTLDEYKKIEIIEKNKKLKKE